MPEEVLKGMKLLEEKVKQRSLMGLNTHQAPNKVHGTEGRTQC